MKRMKLDLNQFECFQCHACCRQEGYVRLEENEASKIARFLEMDILAFTDQYTELTIDRQALSLIEKADGACIFLTDTGCRINTVKPVQCRQFPFKWRFKNWYKICEWAIRQKENLTPGKAKK